MVLLCVYVYVFEGTVNDQLLSCQMNKLPAVHETLETCTFYMWEWISRRYGSVGDGRVTLYTDLQALERILTHLQVCRVEDLNSGLVWWCNVVCDDVTLSQWERSHGAAPRDPERFV